MDWVELKREGILETLTVVFVKLPSFDHFDPYTVAIAKLDGGRKSSCMVLKVTQEKLGSVKE